MSGWLLRLLVGIAMFGAATALAHQELLFARVTTDPPSPRAEERFDLRVRLRDSAGRQIEGVELLARLERHEGVGAGAGGERSGSAGSDSVPGEEAETTQPGRGGEGSPPAPEDAVESEPLAEGEAGIYRATIGPLPAGSYRLALLEVVNGSVESNATAELVVGGSEPVGLELVLPPTTFGGLGNWLVWLVGIPLIAGLLVTILVLTARKPAGE